jgi:hypothetical protein
MDFLSTVGRLDYALAVYMSNDYLDMSQQASNFLVGKNPAQYSRLHRLLTTAFPVIRRGDYWIEIRYVIPGRNTVSSVHRQKIHNPVD